MNKKSALLSFSLSVAILFSILFQSLHSVEHYLEESATECHHEYGESDAEITHEHHNFEDCAICDFTFTSTVLADVISFNGVSFQCESVHSFTSSETPCFFSGSSYSLRGPPQFIV